MNYDSNSNINAFVSNNTNKRSLAVKSFKMTGYTPPLPPLSITIQNSNNVNLGSVSVDVISRSIQNINNVDLSISSVIQHRSIQNDNNVDLGASSVINSRSIQNSNNINLGASSVIQSRTIQNSNNVDLSIPSVIQSRSIQNDNNVDLGASSVINSRSIQNSNNVDLGEALFVEQDLLFTVDTNISTSLTVGLENSMSYSGVIDWGDGSDDVILSGTGNTPITHTFTSTGLTQVRVSGSEVPWLKIPNALNMVSVENLGNVGLQDTDEMFINCTNLTSVNFGNYMTSIGVQAFVGCNSLTSVNFSNSITRIGAYAFYNCTNLTYSSIDGVKYLFSDSYAFLIDGSTASGALYLPSDVGGKPIRVIGSAAFRECTSLTSIIIPDSVIGIGQMAFEDCTNLTSVIIPDSVTDIGDVAFMECSSLTSIVVDTDNPNYSSIGLLLLNKNGTELIAGPGASGDFNIPNSVISIEGYAFRGCAGLTNINIPDSVNSIKYQAFAMCANLTSVIIPDSVTSIETHAFLFCSSLVSATIGNSVTNLGQGLFSNCTLLYTINIYIPKSYIDAAPRPFLSTESPLTINVPIGTSGWVAGTGLSIGGNDNVTVNIGIPVNLWLQTGQDIDGTDPYDMSGYSVSLNSAGNIMAIGAIRAPSAGGSLLYKGQVRIYENVNNIWIQLGQDIYGDNDYEYTGFKVSLSDDGNTVAIAAIGAGGYSLWKGRVRVYQNISNTWTQIGQDINGEQNQEDLGRGLSLNSTGNIIAIGAPSSNSIAAQLPGKVRIYRLIGNIWTKIGADIPSGYTTYDAFGSSVSINSTGNIVAVGAPYGDTNNTGISANGYIKVYENVNDDWITKGFLIGLINDGRWGSQVSLDSTGNIIAIGAGGSTTTAGFVQIRQYDSNKPIGQQWPKIGDNINSQVVQNNFGWVVSLNSDGTIVAIGASSDDTIGSNAGQARVYQNINNTWTQIGQDINGVQTAEGLGFSISISDDGTIVALGSPFADIQGVDQGLARVYTYN